MIDVFLDTSAARSSLQSRRVRKRIEDLVKYGVLKLHVPEIVVMELATGVSTDAFPSSSIYKKLQKGIPWMGDGELATRTEAAVALLRDLRKHGQTEVTQATRAYLRRCRPWLTLCPLIPQKRFSNTILLVVGHSAPPNRGKIFLTDSSWSLLSGSFVG